MTAPSTAPALLAHVILALLVSAAVLHHHGGVALGVDPVAKFFLNSDGNLYINSSIHVANSSVIMNGVDVVSKLIQLDARDSTWTGDFRGCDLAVLKNVSEITGNLYVAFCKSAVWTEHLSKLVKVGGSVIFEENSELTNLDGLVNLVHVGGSLMVYRNPKLTNVDGLQNISVSSFGGSFVRVCGNKLLTSNWPSNLQLLMDSAGSHVNNCLQPGGFPYSGGPASSACTNGCYEKQPPEPLVFHHCFCLDYTPDPPEVDSNAVWECIEPNTFLQKEVYSGGVLLKWTCCRLCLD